MTKLGRTETILLDRFSHVVGYEVLEAEAVGPKLVAATVWVEGRIVRALIADPDSTMGWAFLTDSEATWRAQSAQHSTGGR